MNSIQILTLQIVLFVFLVQLSASAQLCGKPKAEANKTCVSIRLPWQEDPIYFCKSNFKYRRTCGSSSNSDGYNTCDRHSQKGNLLVATPWDCCPMSSTPDLCKDTKCPGKPFNRTCVEIPPPEHGTECCSKFFCEDGLKSKNDCYKKVLQKSCQEPPENKTNCMGFMDPYGCCPKFQCDEDRKPGYCPQEIMLRENAKKHNETKAEGSGENLGYAYGEIVTRQTRSIQRPNKRMPMYGGYHSFEHLECIGDYNCPGKMKCCSNSLLHVNSDGTICPISKTPSIGQCLEPTTLDDAEEGM